ncbi:MAG: anti-sigma factor domain-containing protein [Gaiellaceae bacterium]
MNDVDRDLLAGKALGALSHDEEKHLAELLAQDGAAANELARYRATVATLESGVAREQPSADLFARILGEIEPAARESAARETAAPEFAAPTPAARVQRRRWSWAPRLAAAGFAAATVVLGIAVFTGGGDGPELQAQVAGTKQFAAVSGEASLYRTGRSEGELVLELENVPAPPAGHHYEVWVLRSEGDGAMEAVGSFTPADSDTRLEFRLPGPGDYRAVDVSVEPDGGPPEHSSISLAGASFES